MNESDIVKIRSVMNGDNNDSRVMVTMGDDLSQMSMASTTSRLPYNGHHNLKNSRAKSGDVLLI